MSGLLPSPERWVFVAIQIPTTAGHITRDLRGFISTSAIVTDTLKVIPKLITSPKAVTSANAATQRPFNLFVIIDKTVREVAFWW